MSRFLSFLPRFARFLLLGALVAAGGTTRAARAASNGSRAAAAARDLFAGTNVPALRIVVADDDLDLLRGQRRMRGSRPPRIKVRATVQEGAILYTNVELHIKGSMGSFRGVDDKPALTLDFDPADSHQRFHGLEKISLNNSVQDPTFLCERLGRELFNAAGIPVPRSAYATASLNGRALGLFVLVEGWDRHFLKQHFKDPDGNFYECGIRVEIDDRPEVKSGDHPADHSALEALAAAARDPDPAARWTALQQTLDVDRFLTFLAGEVLLNHWDGYCRGVNNYRVFHDRTTNRIVFLPHGLDQLFALRRPENSLPLVPDARGIVARAVLQCPEGRRRYLERLADLGRRHFSGPAMTNEIRQWANRLAPLVGDEPGGEPLFRERVESLCDQVTRRQAMVQARTAALREPPKFDARHEVVLTGWDFAGDIGSPAFARTTVDGVPVLQITARAPNTTGSWRHLVLLEPGRYRFSATGRVESLAGRNARVLMSSMTVRSSESGQTERRELESGQVGFTHEFTLAQRRCVELVCEFRGSGSRAAFEEPSLILTRLDSPPSAAK